MLIVLVATPITQTAAAAGATSGVVNLKFDADCVVIGAFHLLAVPLTGKRAAVPVAQFVPVPVCTA